MQIYKNKLTEIEVLIAEALLHPERATEALKEARDICRKMRDYGSRMAWAPSRDPQSE